MSDPHTLAGGAAGGAISSVALLLPGVHIDALVLAGAAALFVSLWLTTIDKFHKALAAVLFSALLGAYGSPVAAEWVMSTLPSVGSNHEAMRLLLALVIGSLAPFVVPASIKWAVSLVPGAKP